MATIAAAQLFSSAGRKVIRTSLGVLWALIQDGNDAELWWSSNGGSSWTQATTLGSRNGYSLACDDSYLHVTTRNSTGASSERYHQMALSADHTAITATTSTLLGTGSYTELDVVAYQFGGYRWAHILRGYQSSDNLTWLAYRDASQHTQGTAANQSAVPFDIAADFHHNGDGVTVQGGTPHLYVAWRRQATANMVKGSYAAGVWTWGSVRQLAGSGVSSVDAAAFDGSRFLTLVRASATLTVYERDAADTTTTTRNPPAFTASTTAGASLSYDNLGNIHLFAVDSADGDLKHVEFDRAAGTWGAWATVAAGTFTDAAALRGYRQNAIDVLYEDASNVYHTVAVELNRPPTVALSSPANGAFLDLDEDQDFAAVYSDPDGDSSGGWQFRIKVAAGSYEYWDATDEALEVSPVWNAGLPEFTLPGGTKANGSVYNWSFNVRDDPAQEESGFATDRSFTAADPPGLVVTAPVDPVTDTRRPTAEWTFTGTQATWQHKVFTAAVCNGAGFDPDTSPTVYDSGLTAGTDDNDTPDIDLTNGETYCSYVQGVDNLGVPSGWEFVEYMLDLTPPEAPTVTVDGDDENLSATVTITGGHTELGWPDATVRVERLDPDGQWRTVFGASSVDYDGSLEATVVDHELTPGFPHQWRAFTVEADEMLASDASVAATAVVVSPYDWLRNPYDWDSSVAVHVLNLSVTDPGNATVHRPLDRPDAVVISGENQLMSGSVELRVASRNDREALRSLLASNVPLLLQWLPEDAAEQGEAYWLRFHGDRSISQITPVANPFRRISQTFEEQLRPVDIT
jgi:hypothetical protein